MARTVDTSSTLENFRQEHNNLANDIGAIGNLTTGDTSSIVNAINYIMDQYFFFQDFDFDGSDGASSNTVFSGADNSSNTLQYSSGKVLVYKNGLLLRNGTDYTASNGTSITLGSSANNGDVIRISSYTGSYQNVNSESSAAFDQWQSAGGVIYNKNTGGIVFNADASITTTPTVSSSFQFDGPSYHNDHVHVNAVSSSPKELRFRDADNSNYVALLAPTTIGSNFSLKLPTADGNSGELLSTNGSGQLGWASAGTAPDITITANNSTDETVYPVFVDGATGTQGLESDTGLSYNPSSGVLTATQFSGAISTASQGSITTMSNLVTVGTIGTGVWQGTAIASNYIGADAITGAKIADNAIDSEHYTDGSIDTAHIANSQVTLAKMASNSVDASKIVDNSVGAAELNVSGNGSASQALLSDGDGTFSWGSSGHTTEELQDIIGAMFSGNTETRISATYQDGDGTIDLVVDDMTANDNTQLSTEEVQDIVGAMFSSNTETRISATYEDGDGTIDLVVDDMTADTNTQLSNAQVRTAVEAASDSNVFTDADHTKLNGIEASATADQSNDEIKAAVEAASDSNTFTDADHTKLNGIAASANNYVLENHSTDKLTSGTLPETRGGTGLTSVSTLLNSNTTKSNVGLGNVPNTDCTNASNISSGTLAAARVATLNQNTTGTAAGISGSPTVDLNNLTCDQIGVNVAVNGTDGRIDAGNDIVAYSSSDMTLKENINPITDALDKVLSLGGYTFDWKKEREKEHGYSGSDIGVLAQEVEDVLPTAVRNNCYGNKSVRYEKLIPLLVQSIKELKSELDDLKSSNS